MQRWIGSVLIIFASSAIGIQKGQELQRHLEALLDLRRIFFMLRREIIYKKAPLSEAFSHLGEQIQGEYAKWLSVVGETLEKRSSKTFGETWQQAIETHLRDIKLKQDDIEQLKQWGMNMGFLDEKMQIKTIDLYIEQLEEKIEQVKNGLAEKKKLCHCLGVMGGLFLIVILM